MSDFHGDEAKKKSKCPTQKNWNFRNCQFSIFFCQNFRDWSLDLLDKLMRRAWIWLDLYMAFRLSKRRPFYSKKCILGLFFNFHEIMVSSQKQPTPNIPGESLFKSFIISSLVSSKTILVCDNIGLCIIEVMCRNVMVRSIA